MRKTLKSCRGAIKINSILLCFLFQRMHFLHLGESFTYILFTLKSMPRTVKKDEIRFTSLATKQQFFSCFQGRSCEDTSLDSL